LTTVFLTAASGNWTVPAGVTSVQVECIGPGGNGGDGGTANSTSGAGGASGAYAKKNALSVTAGASIAYVIGAAGSGTDTYFQTAGDVMAKAGGNAATTSAGTAPAGTSSVGDTRNAGANGGTGASATGGGGAGAAGPTGVGKAGGPGGSVSGKGAGGGGSNGGSSTSGYNSTTGNGGPGTSGSGGGAGSATSPGVGSDGTVGGGGGGGKNNTADAVDYYGGNGGRDTAWDSTYGCGGGGGGGGGTNTSGGDGGGGGTSVGYGAGGGGGGRGASGSAPGPGGAGTAGLIVLTYTAVTNVDASPAKAFDLTSVQKAPTVNFPASSSPTKGAELTTVQKNPTVAAGSSTSPAKADNLTTIQKDAATSIGIAASPAKAADLTTVQKTPSVTFPASAEALKGFGLTTVQKAPTTSVGLAASSSPAKGFELTTVQKAPTTSIALLASPGKAFNLATVQQAPTVAIAAVASPAKAADLTTIQKAATAAIVNTWSINSADTTELALMKAPRAFKGGTGNGTTTQASDEFQMTLEAASLCEPGKPYRFGARFVYKSGYTGQLTVYADFYDAADVIIAGSPSLPGTSYRSVAKSGDGIQDVTGMATAPANAVTMLLRVGQVWSTTLSNAQRAYAGLLRAHRAMTWGAEEIYGRPTNLAGLDSTADTKLAGIATGATVGARKGTNLYESDGTTPLTTLAGLNSTEGGKLAGIEALATKGARKGTNLYEADGVTALTTLAGLNSTEGAKLTGIETGATANTGALADLNTIDLATYVTGRSLAVLDSAADTKLTAGLDAAGILKTRLKATVTKTTDSINMVRDNLIADADYWSLGGNTISNDANVTGAGVTKLNLATGNAFKTPTAGANGTTNFAEVANTNSGEFYAEVDQGATYLLSCRTLVVSGFKGILSVGVTWYKRNQSDNTLIAIGASQVAYGTDYRTTAAAAAKVADIRAVTRAPTLYGSQTLTFTGQPANNETVTTGGKAYKFRTAGTSMVGAPDGEVLIGANTAASVANLIAAINLAAGLGTTYSDQTLPNPVVSAAVGAGTTIVVTSKDGVTPSSVILAEAVANATWGATTLVTDDSIVLARLTMGVTWQTGSAQYAYLALPRMKEALDIGVVQTGAMAAGAVYTDVTNVTSTWLYEAADNNDTTGAVFGQMTVLSTGKEIAVDMNFMARSETTSGARVFKVTYFVYDAAEWAASGTGATPIASAASRDLAMVAVGTIAVNGGTRIPFQSICDVKLFRGLPFKWVTVVARIVPYTATNRLQLGIGSSMRVADDRTRSN
jgi:hypothetical protein